MDVTAKIVRFVIDIDLDRVPARALANARIAVRDCLGVALAGSAEPSARICAAVARQETAREEATVIGQGFRSSALQAAFVNGTAAHALDFDHSLALMGQPTAPIIPAAFTLADSSNASGRRFLEAMIAGFEVTAKLVYSLRDASESGWHAPGILGLLGAAAASAKLSGLGPEQIETALGIGASMAGGVAANFGTMTKPLHVGLAARSGLLAGKLAAAGFSAGRRAIESGSGLYEMFYKGAVVNEQPIQELGTIYSLEADGVRIKPYPCGGLTHPV
ncbi:MAG TPA: MmgE/PrpD family protein, partial [Candidatus Binatia bacterium]|nr:MmgE/PrpD family protein [Candidatus Binatia bacterium]